MNTLTWQDVDEQEVYTPPSNYPMLLTVEEIDAEAAELEDDIEDREWHSRGNW
jgi:hypothetical protein